MGGGRTGGRVDGWTGGREDGRWARGRVVVRGFKGGWAAGYVYLFFLWRPGRGGLALGNGGGKFGCLQVCRVLPLGCLACFYGGLHCLHAKGMSLRWG